MRFCCWFGEISSDTFCNSATLDAIRQLQQRIEQLEGERNAQPHVTTPESPVAAGITPRTAAQYSSPVSVYAPSPSANSATTVSASAPRSAPAVEARALRVPGGRIGLNWYFKGMQFLSPRGAQWMTSATGRQVSLDTFKPLDSVLDGFHSATWATQSYGLTVLSELPDERSTHDAVETIYASSIPFCASVLDRVLFQDTIKRAYEVPMDAHSSPFQAPSRACIWALHAIASRLQPRGKQTIHDTETCVNKAQVLINLAAEVSTLETLQAVLLLVRYTPGSTLTIHAYNERSKRIRHLHDIGPAQAFCIPSRAVWYATLGGMFTRKPHLPPTIMSLARLAT